MSTETDNQYLFTAEQVKEMDLTARLSAITVEIGPIAKTKRPGDTVSFKYRSIDDVQNHLNPLLAYYGVTVQSKIINIQLTSREFEKTYNDVVTKKIAYTAVAQMAFIFSDGKSSETWEEAAMSEDYADKAVTQAMSMAYKYALIRKFCITTEDMTDPDSRQPDYRDNERDTERSGPKPTAWLNERTPEWDEMEQKIAAGEWKLADVKAKWKTNKKQDEAIQALVDKAKSGPKPAPVAQVDKNKEKTVTKQPKLPLTNEHYLEYQKQITNGKTEFPTAPAGSLEQSLRLFHNNVIALTKGTVSFKQVGETFELDEDVKTYYKAIAKRQE